MTYTELKAQIASYFHRTDLTAVIPNFIALAEAAIYRELNLRDFETSVTGTTVGGYIVLPSDFGSASRVTVTANGVERNIEYVSRPDDYVGGQVEHYSQENGKLRLFPASSSEQVYKLYYLVNQSVLSDSSPTNWLSINAPDLYFYAACYECAVWARDEDQTVILAQKVKPLIDSVRSLSERRALPQRGNLQIRARPSLV